MDWIIRNKDWLFSGVAIAAPLTLIGWFLTKPKKFKQSQKSGNNCTNIQVGKNLSIASKEVDE